MVGIHPELEANAYKHEMFMLRWKKVHSYLVFALVCAHRCSHRFIELKHATCREKVNILGQWKTKITFRPFYPFMLVPSAVHCNNFRLFANCLPCEAPLELSLSPPKIKCGRSLSHLFCWTAYFCNGNNTCRKFNMSQQNYKLGEQFSTKCDAS